MNLSVFDFLRAKKNFDKQYYLAKYPDVKIAGINPWRHYIKWGMDEGRFANLQEEQARMKKTVVSSKTAAPHREEGRKQPPTANTASTSETKNTEDPAFPLDEQYYLQKYGDVRRAGMSAKEHYTRFGCKEGRFANARQEAEQIKRLIQARMEEWKERFDASYYLGKYKDVARSGLDPFYHFCKSGITEGRYPNVEAELTGSRSKASPFMLFKVRKNETQPGARRILLVTHEITHTGAPLSLRSIAALLISKGYEVDIWTYPTIANPVFFDEIDSDVYIVPRAPKDTSVIVDAMKSYDLVILNTITCGIFVEICYRNDVNHVWLIREAKRVQLYIDKLKLNTDIMRKDIANIYCVSDYARQCIKEIIGAEPSVIHNFIEDITHAAQPIPKKLAFSLVGIMCENKGIHTCLEAFLQLSPALADKWELNLLGSLPDAQKAYWEPLKELTKNYSNIIWHGEKRGEDKWKIFNDTSVFIVPSLDESSSRVVMEAAMMGRPSIVSQNVGAAYIVRDGAGTVFETNNSAALMRCLNEVISSTHEDLSQMGLQARRNYEATSTPAAYEIQLDALLQAHLPEHPVCEMRKKNRIELDLPDCNLFFSDYIRPEAPHYPVPKEEVAVIIPVYNGVQHLKTLVPSLFENTTIPHLFIFVDDKSDQETADWLQAAVKDRTDCVYSRNEENLGFVATVNKGTILAGKRDFVILNSDTKVPPYWLRRLVAPLHCGEKIASVTPLSNCATIFSFPILNNDAVNSFFLQNNSLESINKVLGRLPSGSIDVPTAHGFCMAISRKAWEEIGEFNLRLYGRGYGEETDWSQRARNGGWKHRLAPNLYVAHYHKGSFSTEEKIKSCARAKNIIERLYPQYPAEIRDFVQRVPQKAHFATALLMLAASDSQEKVIIHCNDNEQLSTEMANLHLHKTSFIFKESADAPSQLFLSFCGMIIQFNNMNEENLMSITNIH